MFLIPLGVDVPMQRIPWMNWALMLLIVFAYGGQLAAPDIAERFILGADGLTTGDFFPPRTIDELPLSWIGHIFLHGGFFHMAGNLIFMWAFGNAVCAKIGNVLYGAFFVGMGLLAGLSHMTFSGGAMLGASGAINGVVGAFLILYPTNEMSVFLFLFLVVIYRAAMYSVRSFWIILYWFAWDVLGFLVGAGNVAYAAHLGGFLGGLTVLLILLKVGLFGAADHEKNLLEVIAESRGREIRPPRVRFASEKPNAARMTVKLHVRLPSGKLKRLPVIEFISREGQGKDVNHFVVSEDGRNWTTFGDWRKANL